MRTEATAAKGPVRMVFPDGKTIRVATAPERYLFRLDRAAHITVNGGGCTFLLPPEVRFLHLTNSRNITFRNLKIDFDPLPFADARFIGNTIREPNAKVQIDDCRSLVRE